MSEESQNESVEETDPQSDKPVETLDFETALAQLEAMVEELEQGQVGLTDSLEQYEKGVKYLKQCYKLLERAEARVEILSGVDADGTPQTAPFSDGGAESLSEKADNRSRRRSAKPATAPKPKRQAGEGNVDVPRGLF